MWIQWSCNASEARTLRSIQMLVNSAGICPTPRLGTDHLSFTTSKHLSNLWHQRRSARATSLEGDPLAKDLASVPKGPVRVPTSEWRTPRGQGRRRRSKRRRPMRRMVVSLSPIEATCGGSGSQFQQAMRTHAYQMLRGRPSSMSSSTKLTLETVRRSISRADSRDPNFSMAKTFVGGYGLDLHYDRRLNNLRALFRQRDGRRLLGPITTVHKCWHRLPLRCLSGCDWTCD